VSRGYNP